MTRNQPNKQPDVLEYNRRAWNAQVQKGCKWTVPASPEAIQRTREGKWQIVLTPSKPIPKHWFPDFKASICNVLCLASGGGQQGPILAAAGAQVTVFDYSDGQLAQDRLVADREGLNIDIIQGNMANLSELSDESFDLIVHPCSNCFVADVLPVWREAFRVLKRGGQMLAGFSNPIRFIFNDPLMEKGVLRVEHKIPYSDLTSISEQQRQHYVDIDEPICFGHSLEDQIAGQIAAGFRISGFYEDSQAQR